MKRKFIILCAIALAGFALTLNLFGCKKDKPKEAPAMEENSDDDSDDDSSDSD